MLHHHQAQQTEHLRLVGHQRRQSPPEPDRLVGKVESNRLVGFRRQVCLVEHQIHDAQDTADPVWKLVTLRHAVRNPLGLDLRFRPDDPLGHGGRRHTERTGDLVGGEPGDAAQREGDLRIDVERRVAAREDQAQTVVVDTRVPPFLAAFELIEIGCAELDMCCLLPCRSRLLATDSVDTGPARHGEHPGVRVVGESVDRPPLGRREPRLLEGVLGETEVAELTDQRGEDAARVLTNRILESLAVVHSGMEGSSISGRTSMRPWRAVGSSPANSWARSSPSTSTR